VIRSNQIYRINGEVMTKQVDEVFNDFKHNEPFLHSWMVRHARSATDEAIRLGLKDQRAIMSVYNNVCLPYLYMWMLQKETKDDLVDKIISADQFRQFIQGKAGDKFYDYSTDGLSSDSTLYQAKVEKIRIDLQELRKRLIPVIAEDIGLGVTKDETLRRIDGLSGIHRTKKDYYRA